MHMHSPFQQYLGTNEVPTIEEARQIREVVNSAMRGVHDIDVEIEKHQRRISILQKERSQILDYAEQHQALISPARTLPEDVLASIFLACLPEEGNPSMYAEDAPSLLTRICSLWRRVALSTPRLWAAFHVRIPLVGFPDPSELERQIELAYHTQEKQNFIVNLWIGRSGACPLTISIFQDCDDQKNSAVARLRDLQARLIGKTLLQCRQRWYNLDVCISDELLNHLIEALSTIKDVQQMMLNQLHISCPGIYWFPWTESSPPVKNILPILPLNVTSASFYNIYIDSAAVKASQWMHLTELNLKLNYTGYTGSDTPWVLRQFPSLISLSLVLDRCQYWAEQKPIVLQKLTTLKITVSLPEPCVKSFYLPSIMYLKFNISGYTCGANNADFVEEAIQSLLQAKDSFHTLELSEFSWGENASKLIQVLKAVPVFKCLKISLNRYDNWIDRWRIPSPHRAYVECDWMLNDDLLHALMLTNEGLSHTICPQLEALDICYEARPEFSELALKNFLIARRNAHLVDNRISPVRRVHVYLSAYKRKNIPADEQIISLGPDSAIYFPVEREFYEEYLEEVYTEL